MLAAYFLFSVLFGFILLILWLQIAARYFRIDPRNQVAQLAHTLTHPLTEPLNKFLKLPENTRYDFACFVLLLVVELIKMLGISMFNLAAFMPFIALIMYIIADLVIQPLNLLFYALIIRMIMSFINPEWYHPLGDFINKATNPVIHLGRKIIPNISGFDFAPYLMMVILKVIVLVIAGILPGRLL